MAVSEGGGDADGHPLFRAIDDGSLPEEPERPCAYLPGRVAREQAFAAERLPGGLYHDLMDRGFRRAGHVFYRMRCPACRACVPIRVPVVPFTPTRSQRRVMRRNRDVTLQMAPALRPARDEVLDVYGRYLAFQHPSTRQGESRESMEAFLYEDCVDTIEVSYRVDGRLMGVSVLDVCERSWSSVYHFFEPDFARRSPGVFSVMAEIEICRRLGVPHYYLGYWIAECPAMAYKADYRPCEILENGAWRVADRHRSVSPTIGAGDEGHG